MYTIISSLVILQYNQLYHPKSRRCLRGTRLFFILIAAYLPKLIIHNNYHGVIFFKEAQISKSKCTKHKVW